MPAATYKPDALQATRVGVRADGTTDDAAALQAALDAAQTQGRALVLPKGTIRITSGVTMATHGQEVIGQGPGRTIIRVVGNIVGLTITKSSLVMGLTTTVRGLQFLGGGVTEGTGIKVAAGGVSALNLSDVYLKSLLQGVELDGLQFGVLFSARAESCDVGFYLHSTAGGGNNNTWQTCTAQGCNVGLVAIEDGVYPIHSNHFINLSAHDNGICGVYLDGVDDFHFDTPAHENNGSSGPLTRYGKSIARGTWHFVNSRVSASDCQWTTGTPDPNLTLKTSSVLTFDGNYTGTQMKTSVDATSRIFFNGHANMYGRISGVVTWPAATLNNPVQIIGEAICSINDQIPNTCPTPRMLNFASYSGSGSTFGTETDATLGLIPYVQFDTAVGTSSTNRVVFDTKSIDYVGSTIVACSWLMRADRDCAIQVRCWDDSTNEIHSLFANRLYRLVAIAVIAGTKGKYVIIHPTDAAGAKLNIFNCHALPMFAAGVGGSAELQMQTFVKYGWFNPGKQTYAATNVTPDRAFDADSTTTAELADVLGTLIADLRARGVLV